MFDGLIALLGSKKAIVAITAVIVSFAASYGVQIDATSLAAVLSPVIAYLIGQGIADSGKESATQGVMGVGDSEARPGFWGAIAGLLQSKKAASMIVGVIVTVSATFGLHLSPEIVLSVVSPLLMQIVSQGVADKGKEASRVVNSQIP